MPDNFAIAGQREISCSGKGYRIDFVVEHQSDAGVITRIAVECDGHDFHEKTKEQVRRDKRRDRALTAAGYIPVHFAGSEIVASPYRCVKEVFALLRSRA